MKHFVILMSMLSAWILLMWCSSNNTSGNIIQNSQPITNCSADGYYEKLKVIGNYSLMRDESRNVYSVTIPELCLEIISSPRNSEIDSWHNYIEENFKNNLSINIENNKIIMNNDTIFLIEDKNAAETLQESINSRYYLWIPDGDEHSFYWEDYCAVTNGQIFDKDLYVQGHILWESDKNSQFIIQTPYNIAKMKGLWQISLYRQLCWTEYPFQDIWFWINIPYNILYDDKFPTRYILYSVDWWHEINSPNMNITFHYLD